MQAIEFTGEEKDQITQKIKKYFAKELDYDIGQFDAEFLVDFFAKEVGNYFYNRGLLDAQDILEARLDTLTQAIYELELPTNFKR